MASTDIVVSKTFYIAWAIVHGVTLLLIDPIIQRDRGAELIEHLPEGVVDLFVSGLRAGGASSAG